MLKTLRRAAGLAAVLALAGVTAVSAQEKETAKEKAAAGGQEAEVTVQLAPKNDSGVRGTARIYESEPEAEVEEEAEAEEHGEEYEHGEGEEHEESHAHRVVVELEGLEAGQTYPVHVHRGSCAEGGPVLIPLESVEAGASGSGSATTTISGRQLAEAMEKMESEGEGEMEGEGHEHPSVFIQAHQPGGTPAACGDVPMGDDEGSGEGY